MKIYRILLLSTFLLLAAALTACTGSIGSATGWPGVTVDAQRGVVYVANGAQVHAVNLTDGSEKWLFPAKPDANYSYFAQPVLTKDGQLLVAAYNNKSTNSTINSLNPDTGQENQVGWPFIQASGRFISAPLVTADAVYAPNGNNTLYALGLDGKTRWTFQASQPLWATPATDGKLLFLPSMDHYVYALDAATGRQVWKSQDLGGSVVGTPTLSSDGKTLYVGSFGSAMFALDAATGKQLWRTPTDGWVWSGPVQSDGQLYFGDLNGFLYNLGSDGSVKWKVQVDQSANRIPISDRPLLKDGALYISSGSGTLFVMDAATGNPRSSKPVGGRLYAGPVDAVDLLLVAPSEFNTMLFAYDWSGNQKWTYPAQKKQ